MEELNESNDSNNSNDSNEWRLKSPRKIGLQDFETIKTTGATSIKLPYYQHDDFILDCCDQYGIIAQVEIPLIEKYDRKANANAIEQLKEMIYQSRHHRIYLILFRLLFQILQNQYGRLKVKVIYLHQQKMKILPKLVQQYFQTPELICMLRKFLVQILFLKSKG